MNQEREKTFRSMAFIGLHLVISQHKEEAHQQSGQQYEIFFECNGIRLSSEDVRQTHDLSLKPSHPLNSGSRRPPSECFLCVAIKNAARIRQSLAPLGSPHTTPLSVL
ncbi:hypothetical protein H0G86_012629 [Trichoderma simmonsii]|uniref:Uncharacterized protein n=1 Tax=Trichoderma simmonsii TaxID=1491479 RepID=A0A8G0LPH3_9HYPO|nr:hypothetical protein H0G86_012629 [Trichoderma simmonsii]